MAEIFDIFAVIGFCITIHSIAKIFHERKMNKLADQTARRFREERKREQFAAEGSNMTTGGTRAIFHPAIGWLVPSNTSESEMRSGEEPT